MIIFVVFEGNKMLHTDEESEGDPFDESIGK